MKIIDIKQGTPEWNEFRRKHIGASDSPAIAGVSPWKTIEELWAEKVFDIRMPVTGAMQRGIDLEPHAREYFIQQTGIEVFPLVAEDEKYPFLSASYDGISLDHKTILEIKCPSSIKGVDRYPEIYIPQFQKQMYIAGVQELYYLSYFVCKKVVTSNLFKVQREQEYIDKMIDKEVKFWETIKDLL